MKFKLKSGPFWIDPNTPECIVFKCGDLKIARVLVGTDEITFKPFDEYGDFDTKTYKLDRNNVLAMIISGFGLYVYNVLTDEFSLKQLCPLSSVINYGGVKVEVISYNMAGKSQKIYATLIDDCGQLYDIWAKDLLKLYFPI